MENTETHLLKFTSDMNWPRPSTRFDRLFESNVTVGDIVAYVKEKGIKAEFGLKLNFTIDLDLEKPEMLLSEYDPFRFSNAILIRKIERGNIIVNADAIQMMTGAFPREFVRTAENIPGEPGDL